MKQLVREGVVFPESPRWHDGRLWFSDVYDFSLKAVDGAGHVTTVAKMPGRPSGLGTLPDGRMLVATALDRVLYAVTPTGQMEIISDLSERTPGLLNDMVVDARGRAYVGDNGFNPASGEPFVVGRTWLVAPGTEPRVVAEDMHLPNGCAISEDGRTLYVAETYAERITCFAIEEDGRLSARRVHAQLSSRPDGLCLDAGGHLWVAMVLDGEFVRIDPSGDIVERLSSPWPFALACTFGGQDRDQLFVTSADTTLERLRTGCSAGRIDYLARPVGGAGLP